MAEAGQGAARPGPAVRDGAAPVGGTAYDARSPAAGVDAELAHAADAVLFGAVGDWKYDKAERALRPEQAILGLRKALGLFANSVRRSATPELTQASQPSSLNSSPAWTS